MKQTEVDSVLALMPCSYRIFIPISYNTLKLSTSWSCPCLLKFLLRENAEGSIYL